MWFDGDDDDEEEKVTPEEGEDRLVEAGDYDLEDDIGEKIGEGNDDDELAL